MTKLKEILAFLDRLAPMQSAQDGDNVGHLIGDSEATVERVLVALDLTKESLAQAVKNNVQLIVTHHPVIFLPLRQIHSNDLVYQAIQRGIEIISLHTNMDQAAGGVNDALAQMLWIKDATPFEGGEGMGRIGTLSQPMQVKDFAAHVKRALGCQAVRYTAVDYPIQTVAVLGGGGDFALAAAKRAGADAYVTGEGKHHIFLEAKQRRVCYVDAGHFETERVVCPVIAEKLEEAFPQLQVEVACEKSPVQFI